MDELKRRAAQLDIDLQAVDASTQANTAALRNIREELERNNRSRKWIVAGLVALLALLLVVGFVAFRSEGNIRQAAAERTQLWCPVLARAVGNYNPPQEPGIKRDEYDQNYALIKRGFYEVMRCTNPVVPVQPPR
jgi:hypothetical protein